MIKDKHYTNKIKASEKLRDIKVDCLVSFEKLSKAMDYANSKKIEKAVFIRKNEIKQKKVKVRDAETRKERLISIDNLEKIVC